jgi:RND superfamily putative drug exporter
VPLRQRLLTYPAGRRAKWVVLFFWLAVMGVVIGADLPTKFDDAQKNESTSFLPGDAESTKALEASERIQGDEIAPIAIVYQRDGGLTPQDFKLIEADRDELNADLFPRVSEYSEPIPSPDKDAAIIQADVSSDGESETITNPVEQARDQVADPVDGLTTAVAGGAALSADAIDVFEQIDGALLFTTGLIVLILLLAVYRSPVFWVFPFLAVIFAELTARGLGYGLTEIGVTLNGQSAGIMPVLVFGAGTDYALLLVARYREELRREDDKHEAMAVALRQAGPAILASGLTVIAALLCLTIADVEGTAGLGPIGAMGIGVAMVAMLTALPAFLVIPRGFWLGFLGVIVGMIFGAVVGVPVVGLVVALALIALAYWFSKGRTPNEGWQFWPFVPHIGDEASDETHGFWRRVGDRIAKRPRAIWAGTVALLLVLSLGWLNIDLGLTQGNQFRGDVESVQAQELLAASFPAGAGAPTEVIVPDPAKVEPVTQALTELDTVEDVREAGGDDEGTLLQATLAKDPYSTDAFDDIEPMRDAVKEAGGEDVLVGGPTAVEKDLRVASARDSLLIPPIVLVVVFLILVVLLRALVAPLVLIGTVILSFAAALGIGYLAFDVLFDFPGSDPSLPLYAFIFLVALGVDYNIFLMARVREETQGSNPREGVLRGLAVTGAVITSAGLVLAGTFSALAVLPLVFLTELGFVVAIGVLLDTFIVRSILVPAISLDLGRRTWLPSALGRATDDRG